ncbi:hypothetical protein [Streptomyces sp. NPDC001076]
MTFPTVWMATAEGLVLLDLIAIERAMNGSRKGWTLDEEEARYAARVMLDRKVPYSVIATRVGVNTDKLRSWFPGEIEPAKAFMARRGPRSPRSAEASCGTRSGYTRHQRLGEKPCPPCREANTLADRHYRRHGTYKGAPTPAVAA